MKVRYKTYDRSTAIEIIAKVLLAARGREVAAIDVPIVHEWDTVGGKGSTPFGPRAEAAYEGARRYALGDTSDASDLAECVFLAKEPFKVGAAKSEVHGQCIEDRFEVEFSGLRGSIMGVFGDALKLCDRRTVSPKYRSELSASTEMTLYETGAPWLSPVETARDAAHKMLDEADFTGLCCEDREQAAYAIAERLVEVAKSGGHQSQALHARRMESRFDVDK